ncbi:MAG: GNAT family protein [Thermodesulfovibrionales bacterium]
MLKGKYVGLRAIEKDDLPYLLEWRNNPEYRKYFREYRELGMGQQYSWYEDIVLKDQKTIMFSIIALKSRRLLGACGLCYINWIDRNADLSIYIGADNLYIDKKYAPDTASTIMKYAFDELGLHRLWAEIYDFDTPKIKFFEQLGFKPDGCHRETHWTEGKWCNSLFYSLLQEEFSCKRKK